MPNDERILETMPVGTLGLIATDSCIELGQQVDEYLTKWRENREHQHKNDIFLHTSFQIIENIDN